MMGFRSHNCGELRKIDSGKEVTLTGWVDSVRQHGKVSFINLRDRYGITQVVVKDLELLEKTGEIGSEWVISVSGTVLLRPAGMENTNLATGEIDVEAGNIEIIAKSNVPVFVISDEITARQVHLRQVHLREETRLKYRYLDLRRPSMQKAIIFKSRLEQGIREFLQGQNFIAVETPILGRSTPEGARDFLVPSRLHPGKFYSLVQSPQIYKQLLIIAGFDKYYQFARCFRDEDQRKDRQLEFTQLDIECAFINEEHIFKLIEGLMQYALRKVMNIELPIPFKRMTYQTALETYGTDKPDTRYGITLQDVTEIAKSTDFNLFKSADRRACEVVKCIVWERDLSRKIIDELTNVAKGYNMGLFWLKYTGNSFSGPLAKFFNGTQHAVSLQKELNLTKDSVILFSAGEKKRVCEALGGIRTSLIQTQLPAKHNEYEFVWVTDFPMFEIPDCRPRRRSFGTGQASNADMQSLAPSHHIFVMPKNPEVLDSNPLSAIGRLYDLVLNGVELGSGSIRAHMRELQEKLLEIIGINKEEQAKNFGCLLEALEYGAPPHGGIALGFDRLTAMLLGEESIHNVIAFPKTLAGVGLLEGIPSEVTDEQLEELHIELKSLKV